ncbi:MAG: hypothetical protein HYY84_05645 [Deltaproteobacteria bacterium]|nr:hypothetical protein [Deltaproteobacteria bacterium]
MWKSAVMVACAVVCVCTKTRTSQPYITGVSPTYVSIAGLPTTSITITGGGFAPKVVASASGGVERFDQTFTVAFFLDGGEAASVSATFEEVTRLSIPAGGLPSLAIGSYLLRVATPQGETAAYDGFQVGLVPTVIVSDAGVVYAGSTAALTVSATGNGAALTGVACTRAFAPYVIGSFSTDVSTTCDAGGEPTFPAASVATPFLVAVPSILKFGQPTYADFKATDALGRETTARATIVINACANDSECIAAAPFCRCPQWDATCATTYRRCIACEVDSDCSGTTPRCEPVSQFCVRCLVNGDCSPGTLCSGNECVSGCIETSCGTQKCFDGGACVECLNDVDCGADGGGGIICDSNACRAGCRSDAECPVEIGCAQTCSQVTFTCTGACTGDSCCSLEQICSSGVCAPGCYDDTRCLPGRRCTGNPGVCADCTSSADCAVGNYCAANVCVPGCDSDARCGAPTPKCDLAAKVCVECLEKIHCGSGEVCTAAHVCASGCFTNDDCASEIGKPFCYGAAAPTTPGACVACVNPADCDAGTCVLNTCFVGCTTDSECPPNANGNRCVDAGCTTGCATSAHCASPKPVCIGSSCQECADGGNCYPAKPFCDSLGYFCRGCNPDDDGGGNADCSGGTPHCNGDGGCVVCTNASHCPASTPLCKNETCATCASNAECASAIPNRPFCDAGMCTPCLSDAYCPTGFTCSSGRCVAPRCESCTAVGSLGGRCASCSGDGDCDTGYRCALVPDFDGRYHCMKSCATSDDCTAIVDGLKCSNRTIADAGGNSGTVCTPSASTTCEAFSQARTFASCPVTCLTAPPGRPSTDDTLCGIPDAGDGECVVPFLGTGYCSIRCSNGNDCPSKECDNAKRCSGTGNIKVCMKP